MMNRPKEKVPPRPNEESKHTGIHKILDDTVTSTYQDVIAIIEAKIELVKIALLTGELLGHPFLGYFIVSLIFLSCFVFFTKLKPLLLKELLQKIFLSVNDYKK